MLVEAQEVSHIPKQEAFCVEDGDGLGGKFSVVLEVLGGLPGGTVEMELTACRAKLKTCGIRQSNTIFVRLIQLVVRNIEEPGEFAKLPSCHHIVFLSFPKVICAHSSAGQSGYWSPHGQ